MISEILKKMKGSAMKTKKLSKTGTKKTKKTKKMAKKQTIVNKTKKPNFTKINDHRVGAEVAFYCIDGNVFYSLSDLSYALGGMSKGTFIHHVNNEKNDFCNWIKDVFQEQDLGIDISKTKTAKAMKKKIDKYLK